MSKNKKNQAQDNTQQQAKQAQDQKKKQSGMGQMNNEDNSRSR